MLQLIPPPKPGGQVLHAAVSTRATRFAAGVKVELHDALRHPEPVRPYGHSGWYRLRLLARLKEMELDMIAGFAGER